MLHRAREEPENKLLSKACFTWTYSNFVFIPRNDHSLLGSWHLCRRKVSSDFDITMVLLVKTIAIHPI